MVRKYSQKRKYKKRAYKKRVYKRRYYKRRYYKPIKKPEIYIVEDNNEIERPFNDTTYGVGTFQKLNQVGNISDVADMDQLKFSIIGKPIEGKKVRLKYLYMKGYIKVGASTAGDADDFNCKLMVFRWKRNTTNQSLYWGDLMNDTLGFNKDAPSTWTESNRLQMMYMQDWRNDIKINFYKKVKNLYRKYDDANNIIPFKMRIPLYDCVMTCDCYKRNADNLFTASPNPSTNGLYFTFLSNKYDANTVISYRWKLYYTDY